MPGSPSGYLPESQVLDDLKAIASQFEIGGVITSITPLGEGNVNETYQVICQENIFQDQFLPEQILQDQLLRRYVMQRINTAVFPRPELVMANINVLASHVASRPLDKGWVMPTAIPIRNSGQTWLEREGQIWRMLTFVENAQTLQTIGTIQEAQQVGRAAIRGIGSIGQGRQRLQAACIRQKVHIAVHAASHAMSQMGL